MLRCLLCTCVLLTAGVVAGSSASADTSEVTRAKLVKHSFDGPLTYEKTLVDWDMSGATIPANDKLILVPSVANRTGNLWHKDPIMTTNFEIEFSFQVKGSDFTKSPGFAFWYVSEEFAKVYPLKSAKKDALENFKLFAYKGNFAGLGVFFSTFDRNGKLRPSVSAVWNDGTKTIDYTQVPTNDMMNVDFRNSASPIKFRVAVGPEGMKGLISLTQGISWTDCFSIPLTPEVKLPPSGYLGFSGDTGPEEGSIRKEGDYVAIHSLVTYNFDLSKTGEDTTVSHIEADNGKTAAADTLNLTATGDIIRDHSSHKDEHEHAEALRQLTRLVYKHVSESGPREQIVQKTMTSLSNQINKLAADLATLTREVRAVTHTNHSDAVSHLKTELVGLRQMLHRDVQQQSNTLVNLHKNVETLRLEETMTKDAEEVRKLTQKAAMLEQTVKKHSSMTIYLVMAVAVLVAAAAMVVYKKQKDMEKRHLL